MKKTFKERIDALGLNYSKEIFTILLLVLFVLGVVFAVIIFLKEIYIAVIAFGIGVTLIYFYTSRYSAMERQLEKDRINELITLLSYFEIFITNGNNTYTSFKMLLPYASMYLEDAIKSMLNQIDVDKTIGPFINFASKFNNAIIESLMLSIYQMVDNGEDVKELTEFDILFNTIKDKHQTQLIENKKKTLDSLNSLPLFGAGGMTIVLSLSIISIIGDYINVL